MLESTQSGREPMGGYLDSKGGQFLGDKTFETYLYIAVNSSNLAKKPIIFSVVNQKASTLSPSI